MRVSHEGFMDGRLSSIYEKLLSRYGELRWWPAETSYEVMVGAVLTQNTAWGNVEKAIANFGGDLSPEVVLSTDLAELAEIVEEVSAMEHLTVEGLSTVAPLSGDPERVRWVFRRLAELASELEAGGPGRRVLSMGMTDDFEVAVEEGSTCVRVGTGIFGPRARE